MNLTRWRRLMQQWRAPDSEPVYTELVAAYSEPHRRYHTVQHIEDCLTNFDEATFLAQFPEEVELALWFHDAVYKPTSTTNERESADWAVTFLDSIDAAPDKRNRVHEHIMTTRHTTEPARGDTGLVVDVDLSILGSDKAKYDTFEGAIREEYRWVPMLIYRRKRIAVLESFLSRPSIYNSEHFRGRYETPARQNLARAIEGLRG